MSLSTAYANTNVSVSVPIGAPLTWLLTNCSTGVRCKIEARPLLFGVKAGMGKYSRATPKELKLERFLKAVGHILADTQAEGRGANPTKPIELDALIISEINRKCEEQTHVL